MQLHRLHDLGYHFQPVHKGNDPLVRRQGRLKQSQAGLRFDAETQPNSLPAANTELAVSLVLLQVEIGWQFESACGDAGHDDAVQSQNAFLGVIPRYPRKG